MSCRGQDLVSRLDRRALEFMRMLNRKRVFAHPASARNGIVPMMRDHPAGIKRFAECPQSIWTKFVALGLVGAARSGRQWELTNLGKDVAKLAKVQLGQTAGKSKSPPKIAGDGRKIRRNEHESPLAWLARRKGRDGKAMVNAAQFQAGERLRHDFFRAQLSPNVTMDWSMAASANGSARHCGTDHTMMNDMAIVARMRVNAALDAVGPELGSILIDVCCHLKGLETSERDAGWPRRSGKVILQLALTRLARHYGFVNDDAEMVNGSRRVIRHWGRAGYRPQMDFETDTPSVDE